MDVPNHLADDHPLLSADRRVVIDAAFAEVQPTTTRCSVARIVSYCTLTCMCGI